MAERERTILARALYRLNDPVFVTALSPRDRSSISQPVAHFCRDQETEMSSKEEEEGCGNQHNWPGTNFLYLARSTYASAIYHSNCYSTIT